MKKLHLRGKLILFFLIIFVSALLINVGWRNRMQSEQMVENLKEKAEILAEQMSAVWRFMDLNQAVINYTSEGEYDYKGLHCAIAGKSIGAIFTKETRYIIHYTNENPRNPRDMPDAFESEAIRAFRQEPERKEYYAVSEYEGKTVFRFLSVLTVDESCLECHGGPVGEPDVLGYAKEGWELGEVGGAISMIIPMDSYLENQRTLLRYDIIYFLVFLLLLCILIYLTLSRMVISPLNRLKGAVNQMRGEDLSVRVPEKGMDGEFWELADSFNGMAGELSDLYENLETQVEHRTEQLKRINQVLDEQQKQLQEANQRLAEENRYKSDFLTIMSHELRTPLTSIMAFTEVMQKTEEMPEHKKILAEIMGNSQILLSMINNILEMARIQSGRAEFSPEWVDFGDVAGQVNRIIRPLAEKKNQDFSTSIAPDVPLFYGDWEKLRRIMENLLSNAVKYTPAGGHIRMDLTFDPQKRLVRIRVQDDGIGISEEDLPGVFDRFVQSDHSASRRYNGSGLGLAVARELTEFHRGTIRAESRLGAGSTFLVELPVENEVEEETDNEDHAGGR